MWRVGLPSWPALMMVGSEHCTTLVRAVLVNSIPVSGDFGLEAIRGVAVADAAQDLLPSFNEPESGAGLV